MRGIGSTVSCEPGRLLDGSERRFWLLGREVSVNALLVVRVRGALAPAALRAALDAAQARQPPLRLRIDDGPPPRFVDDAVAVPLRIVRSDGDDAWRGAAETDLTTPFPSAPGPLLRMTLVQGGAVSDVVVTWHHALCDGFATFGLIAEVLRAAAGDPAPATTREGAGLAEILPPGVRGLAGRVAFLRDAQQFAVEQKRVKPEPLRRDVDAPLNERRTRIVQHRLDPAATAALAKRAQREGTTVQGALVAAALRTVRTDAGRDLGLGCQHAVDLRRYLTPVAGAFGNYTVGVPTFHHVGTQSFWDLGREARSALAALLERRMHLLIPAYLEETIPRDAAAAGDVAARADGVELAAVAVTNLGRMDASPLPGLPWDILHIAPAMGVGNVLALAAATIAGTLTCNFVTCAPLVARSRAERLADRAMAELRAASADG